MTEHTQRQRQARPRAEQEQVTESGDLRNEELDEDTACCLAEIDKVLAETQESERDAAIREFRALNDDGEVGRARRERLWRAQYAHLGLRIVDSCCKVALFDKDTHHVIATL